MHNTTIPCTVVSMLTISQTFFPHKFGTGEEKDGRCGHSLQGGTKWEEFQEG